MSKTNTLLNYFSSPKGGSPKAVNGKSPASRSARPPSRSRSETPKRKAMNNKDSNDNKLNGKTKGKLNGKVNGKARGGKDRKRSLEYDEDNDDDDDDHRGDDDNNDNENDENVENAKERGIFTPKPNKRRRIVVPNDSSDNSEDDYKPEQSESSEGSEDSEESLSEESFSEEMDEDESPKKKPKKLSTNKKSAVKIIGKKSGSKNDSILSNQEQPTAKASDTQSWPHLKYDFLQPDKIKDNKKRPSSHPDYDPKTVYVPPDFLSTQTPAMNQWWSLKTNHFDCVLFFKVGKFYELYHMDAVIGVKELSLSFMRGEFAHSGFPEIAYGRFSASLIERGYKVARIEQTENPEMMSQRCAKMSRPSKFDKVVKREICQISTKGTRIYTAQDAEPSTATSSYLLAIVENYMSQETASAYGVCFIDTTIGEFNLGQFQDDSYNSRLLTLLAHYPPAHIIYERGNLTRKTLAILNNLLSSVMKDALQKDSQFWSSTKVLQTLHEDGYFMNAKDSKFSWPKGLQSYLNKRDTLGLTPSEEKELAVTALGGCVYLLREYQLDRQLLSQGRFKSYVPPDFSVNSESSETNFAHNMVLDAMTINNLRVLGNDGSLIKTLDHCCTAFGKRLLQEWICRPSCRKAIIIERQEAVTQLLDNPDVVQEVRGKLSRLPDLERLLSIIHSQGNSAKSPNHPDRRAILFEGQTYSKRTIVQFITALNGFEEVINITECFNDFTSSLITKCTNLEPEGSFTELRETLDNFKMSFDHEEAKKEGFIVPKEGVDSDYDAVLLELADIKKELQDYLAKQKRHFGVSIQFCGSGRKKYQIEVPESQIKKVGSGYELQGSRKGFKKYYTNEAKDLLARETAAEEQKEKVLKNSNGKIFGKFSELYDRWSRATYNIAVLDCLISFAEYARSCDTCVPIILDDTSNDKIFIEIIDGKHPCIVSDNFIPNDTAIATGEAAPLMILTGPNMGGKSTVMRQVGLITIMAQIGCHVPATACRLTLVDRIFTRIGANDDIMAGQSTFLVELSETAAILQHATKYSLVLLDELGRGTSTYDGTAIAASVVEALTKTKCRTIFSTHYHSLVEDYKTNNNVSLAHMACMVENEDEEKISEENVTFLYKLSDGACPKSYGFNAARLAGVPVDIVKRAHDIATKLETEVNLRHAFVSLCTLKDSSSVVPLLRKIVF